MPVADGAVDDLAEPERAVLGARQPGVVTNVLPYVIALSALWVMMRDAKVEPGTHRLNTFVATVAIAYSIYALYASGKGCGDGRHARAGPRLPGCGLHRAALRAGGGQILKSGG